MNDSRAVVVEDKVHRPVHDEMLTEFDLAKAKKELNETEEVRMAVIQRLKELLANEENEEMRPRTDDLFLLRFLRVRKFNCNHALKSLQEYYSFRANHPSLYPLPSQVEKALKANFFTVLPHRDSEGRAIFVLKMGLYDPINIPFSDFLGAINLVGECLMDNPVTQVNGFIGIWDTKGISLRILLNFTLRRIRLITDLIQGRFPGRLKMAYIVNPLPFTYTIYQCARPFVKEKFRDRVKILGNMNALHQYIAPEILPLEYGGHMPKCDSQQMAQWVLSQEDAIKYDRTFGYHVNNTKKE